MSSFIRNLPAWAGSTFTKNFNSQVPASLDPSKTSLPTPFVAVVTGSSKGIGAGIARCFAQAGATGLVLTARKAESCEKTRDECLKLAKDPSKLKVTMVGADNALEESAIKIAEHLKQEHAGRVDLLVNNAGWLLADETAFNKVAEINSPNIEDMTKVCYWGRFYMIKHLMPLILATPENSPKAIVSISSIGSHVSGPLGFSISALATNRLSQRVDESYADQGVVCYSVHPGAVWSDGPKDHVPERMKEFSKDSPDLCGSFLVWLVKEKRQWLSGRYVDATWDVEELKSKKDEIVEGDKLKMRLVV